MSINDQNIIDYIVMTSVQVSLFCWTLFTW